MANVIDNLNSLAAKLRDNFSDINYGGCGVVAAMVATRLSNRGVPVLVRVANDRRSLTQIRQGILKKMRTKRLPTKSEWNCAGVCFGHVVVEFEHDGEKYHFDSNGVVKASSNDPTFGSPIMEGHLSVSEAKKIAREDSWNSDFDRDQIPDMRDTVSKFFRKHFA